jgi:hypothetical protein
MSELEDFDGLTSQRGFHHIDDIVDTLDDAGFWKDSWLSETTRRAKKAKVRSLLRQSKGPDGWPNWASIVIANPDGTTDRLYQQERLFAVEDYQQVIRYWVDYAQHGQRMAEGYRDRMVKRGGEQLTLPWE